MPETPAPLPFVMHGAREVLDAGAVHIEQQIIALEGAVGSNSGLAFDVAKTLLESACKTVLSERECGYDNGWDLPKLLKETLGQLRLVPAGLDGEREVSESLRRRRAVYKRLSRASVSCEIRTASPHTVRKPRFSSLRPFKLC
jgi:hypothetical protein